MPASAITESGLLGAHLAPLGLKPADRLSVRVMMRRDIDDVTDAVAAADATVLATLSAGERLRLLLSHARESDLLLQHVHIRRCVNGDASGVFYLVEFELSLS